jgi:hypothetical protein
MGLEFTLKMQHCQLSTDVIIHSPLLFERDDGKHSHIGCDIAWCLRIDQVNGIY